MTVQDLRNQLAKYSGEESVLVIPPQEIEVESIGKYCIGTQLFDVLYTETISRLNKKKNRNEECVLLIC